MTFHGGDHDSCPRDYTKRPVDGNVPRLVVVLVMPKTETYEDFLKRHREAAMLESMDDADIIELARVRYAAYQHHSGGLAWDGKPCPSWNAIKARELTVAGVDITERPLDDFRIRPDGVCAHWAYTAMLDARFSIKNPYLLAQKIKQLHADSEVFLRCYA